MGARRLALGLQRNPARTRGSASRARPIKSRVAINCGVWRYHPTRAVFEAVAHGTTNPWGLDFDDLGEAFITNCVIPHLFHVVPGAHFQRMFGEDLAPYRYALMETLRRSYPLGRRALDRLARGQGQARRGRRRPCPRRGDDLPGRQLARADIVMMCSHVIFTASASIATGWSAGARATSPATSADFLMANDTWFRGLELKYGPGRGGLHDRLVRYRRVPRDRRRQRPPRERADLQDRLWNGQAGHGRPGRPGRRGPGAATASP